MGGAAGCGKKAQEGQEGSKGGEGRARGLGERDRDQRYCVKTGGEREEERQRARTEGDKLMKLSSGADMSIAWRGPSPSRGGGRTYVSHFLPRNTPDRQSQGHEWAGTWQAGRQAQYRKAGVGAREMGMAVL